MFGAAPYGGPVTNGPNRPGRTGPASGRAGRLRAVDPLAVPAAAPPPGGEPSGPAPDRLFPIARLIAALGRDAPASPEAASAEVAAALELVAASARVRGAVLEVCAPPLPVIEVGVGSLAPPPSRDARATLRAFSVGGHGEPEALGRLLLAHDEPAGAALAEAVGLAIDSAWSLAAVRDRVERLGALEAATRAIAAELDVDRVLQVIVDRLRALVGARYAALGTADGRGRIERFITSGMEPEVRAAIGHVPRGLGLLGLIIREGRAVRAGDIAAHPASSGFPANHPPMSSFLGVPILLKGRSIGNLYLTDKVDGPFTEEDERLVEMFAAHAAIAIENARLHDLVQRLAVVEERERIGKDLHDGIIQSIYAVGLSLEDVPDLVEDDRPEAIARVDRAIDALNLVISDIRSYILRLRPTDAGDEDPVAALARLGEEFGLHAVVELDMDLAPGASLVRALPPDRHSDLLFIAREALSNVARHSGASLASLRLVGGDGELALVVEDNGRGFDPDAVEGPDAFGRHQGLTNMRDRAVAMGGSFAVERPDGAGARIIVRVPGSPDSESGARRSSGTEDE